MGWGFTVLIFAIVGFLGLIFGLGLRVWLWHILRITVTVEFFTWVNEVFHGPGWPTHPCLQVLFCVFGCVVEAKYSIKSQVTRQQVHLCVYCDPPNQWYTVCDMKWIIVRGVDVPTSRAFLSANRKLEMFYLFDGKANWERELSLFSMKKIASSDVILLPDWAGLSKYVKMKAVW